MLEFEFEVKFEDNSEETGSVQGKQEHMHQSDSVQSAEDDSDVSGEKAAAMPFNEELKQEHARAMPYDKKEIVRMSGALHNFQDVAIKHAFSQSEASPWDSNDRPIRANLNLNLKPPSTAAKPSKPVDASQDGKHPRALL